MIKRVLHIRADISAQQPIAGVATAIKSYIQFCDPESVENYLCLCVPDQVTGEILKQFFKLPDDRVFLISDFSRNTIFRADFWAYIVKIVRDNQINIIHSHSYKADLIALILKFLTGKKTVSTVHGYNAPANTIKSKIIWEFMRRIWLFFDATVLVSDAQRNIFLFKFLDRFGKVTTIRNFIPEGSSPSPYSKNEQHPFTILTVGRLAYEKNQILLLNALQKLDPNRIFECYIIGDGPERVHLNDYLINSGLCRNVRLLGYLSPDVLGKYYQLAHVLVVTSLFETFSIVMIEAMINKCVVIAPDLGEFHFALADGRGYLYKRNDADDLAGKISFIMDHPDVLIKAAEKSLVEFRLKYSVDANRNALGLVYSKLFKH